MNKDNPSLRVFLKKILFVEIPTESMKRLLVFLLFWSFYTTNGQPNPLILTSEQNNKWLDNLSSLPLDKQLFLIQERLLIDTNIVANRGMNDGIKPGTPPNNKVYGYGSPLIVLNQDLLYIDEKTEPQKIKALCQLLTPMYISKITILKGDAPKTQAIFGYAARSGVLLMAVKRKKFRKTFQQLQLKRVQ